MCQIGMDYRPDLYPLTSLQIGDVKSNLSRAFLYFAPVSHKFLILVDNQSWRKSNHSTSVQIKELVMTKCRTSPFRNTRALLKTPSFCLTFSNQKSPFKWVPLINTVCWQEKAPFSMMNLYKALHGFIVFEVSWKDVRGINYLNELQTDASIALEVKSLIKWEFSSIDQAVSCMSSWFSGTLSETLTLQSNLIHLHNKVPSRSSRGIIVASKELLLFDTSQADLFSEDTFFDVVESPSANNKPNEDNWVEEQVHEAKEQNVEVDSDFKPMGYKDTLLLFRFNDKDLPFKLRQVITSDLKLLTLLESGLPSWVIFLQSYPLFCKLYCPWMRLLFGTLYILISLVTVIIGFYDLYKNVPLLKATASHLCGPLFEWIEAWDMVSRIRYLGTMLFLQNFEKAVTWFLVVMRTVKLLLSPLTMLLMYSVKEMIDFLAPLWSPFFSLVVILYQTSRLAVVFFCSMVLDCFEILLSPLVALYSYMSSLVTSIFPLFNYVLELLLVPVRGCLVLANFVGSWFLSIYKVISRAFLFASDSSRQLKNLSHVKSSSPPISFWHSLSRDIFSKVFRSLQSIIRVLVAFFVSCNRHRLSIYNYLKAIPWQLFNLFAPGPSSRFFREVSRVDNRLKVDDAIQSEHCKSS